MACRGRCEVDVQSLNRIIAQNKTAYEKARGAYGRTALFYGMLGVVFLLAGLSNWHGMAWVLVPASVIFVVAGYVNYATGRRYEG